MGVSSGRDDGSPMMEMNTTPLIDVMLVLLIMFIITIPVATHSINLDLPRSAPPTHSIVDTIKNRVSITPDNRILWNGTTVEAGQLLGLLQQTLTYPVEPELQYQPDPDASYDLSAKVLGIIKGSKVTKFGFVGNDRFSEFSKQN
jgi:biopolymer transport protein ExbD